MFIIHAFNMKTGVFDVIGFRETEKEAVDSAELVLQYDRELYGRCAITHTVTFIEVRRNGN